MKKIIFLVMMAAAFLAVSCDPSSENPPIEVQVSLMYENAIMDKDGVTVTLMTTDNSASYQAETVAGVATFTVIPGLYNASASFTETDGTNSMLYNGSTAVTVSSAGETAFTINLTVSESSQLVIKELYFAGCMDNNGEKAYRNDGYVILYNNGDTELDVSDVAFAFSAPYNSSGTNKYVLGGSSEPSYFSENWIPAQAAVWYFTSEVKIPAYSQITVVFFGAIDHTSTYSNSVDLSSPDNYVMYAPESAYVNAKYAVADGIPSSHYLTPYIWGQGNAWTLSVNSPAFYILEYDGIETYAADPANQESTMGSTMVGVKIPTDWVVDGIEVFQNGRESSNIKRLPPVVDAGSIYMTVDQGYTLYRNVDKEATEALPENDGLLVYNYSGGTVGVDEVYGSTDPSGIDAEASIAAGAHIIYQDTNNSSNDFHQRAVSSLKN